MVILAGGLGTRLGRITKTVPKPMVPVMGRPFLEYELGLLRSKGADDVVLSVGYQGRMIEEHIGDGRRFGMRVRYSYDGPDLLGPAGALRRARHLLEDHFLVTYGDAYLMMDYRGILDRLLESRALGVMAVYRNDGRFGRSDLVVRGERVVRYDKVNSVPGMVWVNFGVTAMARRALSLIPEDTPCGEEEFYGKLISKGQLLAYRVRRRFYEIGSPASLEEFRAFIERRATGRGGSRGGPGPKLT